ncbi:hypothetical protein [Streptomyces violascens]|uniref:hypothetical protein n=1 Tax=Streptomyces violascens TaxID=67381 RepID=UPI0036738AF3
MTGQPDARIPPGQYLREMDETAQYVFAKGLPFFVRAHYGWLTRYDAAWRGAVAGALDETLRTLRLSAPDHHTGRVDRWMSDLLDSTYVRDSTHARKALTFLFLAVVLLPGFLASIAKSLWGVIGGGVRTAPPLVAAVVVVFITSDGWRLLAHGFGLRFALFETLFLSVGLAFLARSDYWTDIAAPSQPDQEELLRHIDSAAVGDLIRRGAHPFPLLQPETPAQRRSVHAGYFILLTSALVGSAVVVSLSLIVVGVVLISASQTANLTGGAAHLYWTIPGTDLVLTRELVSLSLSLGAFAALFLVASQHPEHRTAYAHRVLYRLRRSLAVYSVYRRAREQAQAWTTVNPER